VLDGGPLATLARDALARAECGLYCDPRLLAIALGYTLRLETHSVPWRAKLLGRCINFRYDADPRERGLNIFLGLAAALLVSAGLSVSESSAYRLAAHLALGDGGLPEVAAQKYVPQAFMLEYIERRSNQSGVYRSIAS
jgi:hypothetical protein